MSQEAEIKYEVQNSGRVKAAGVSMGFIFEAAEEFTACPTPEKAAEMVSFYRGLRDAPPSPIRQAFFPRHSKGEVKALTKQGPGLYRPILKTDQGAGQFTGFIGGGELNGGFRIQKTQREGFAITEAYFARQLSALPGEVLAPIESELTSVRRFFQEGDYYEAGLALERLDIACAKEGISLEREAGVGRQGLFFINPFRPECPVVLPQEVMAKAEEVINGVAAGFPDLTHQARQNFASAYNLPDKGLHAFASPAYFQFDIQVQPNGEVVLDQIQLPDLGMFLTTLPVDGNLTLKGIQHNVVLLKERIVGRLAQELTFGQKAALITREEVVERDEDTLEIYELQAVSEGLAERGIPSEIISCRQAVGLEADRVGLLFNVDPKSGEFAELLKARLGQKHPAKIVPDPFLKLIEKELTGYKRVILGETEKGKRVLTNFKALLSEVEMQPERAYRQLLAVDAHLSQLGLEEKVLHFYLPGQRTPAAAFRYDIGSLYQVARMMQNTEGGVEIREIPTSPNRAVLFDDDGAIYNVFRLTALRRSV